MDSKISKSLALGPLPSYKNPPVNEVVCGMQFELSDKINIAHFGLLWNKFRRDYPVIKLASPIATAKGEIAIDEGTGLLIPRVWFINSTDDQLIQFQFDRIYFNWRYKERDYPRYVYVIKNFETVMDTLEMFFKEFDLGDIKPVECELTYINHIIKGQEWDTIDDLPKILSNLIWNQTTAKFLPDPTKVSWMTEFPLQDNKGRLAVKLRQGIRTSDKIPLFILELRAQGIGKSTNKDAVREWFDVAHEWIVRGFTDLTTPEVQTIWQREKDA